MIEIFKNIEGREWDWFKWEGWKQHFRLTPYGIVLISPNGIENKLYRSLADLLSNKSWCQIVWGEKWGHGKKDKPIDRITQIATNNPREYYSVRAFKILQNDSKEACIKYIKESMI